MKVFIYKLRNKDEKPFQVFVNKIDDSLNIVVFRTIIKFRGSPKKYTK